MTSRELRKQRREAERKAKRLEYRQTRIVAASAPEMCGAGSLAGEPVARPASAEQISVSFTPNAELLDEFTAEEQEEMMALRARVHARAGLSSSPEPTPAPVKPGPTGPRSAEGKAISSGNSLKHGLASGRIIIAGEDPAAFETLLAGLTAEHAPATETESLLVKQMAQSWWLMQRALRMQTEAFTGMDVDTHKLALFLRYQTTHERAFYKALNTLLNLNRARGEQRSSASAPKQAPSVSVGAVACPARSQFVSQPRSQSQPEIGFVSQNTHISAASSPSSALQFSNLRPAEAEPRASAA